MIPAALGLAYALQPMALADVPTVADIEREAFTLPWPESAFRSELAHHSSSCYLVARYTPWDLRPNGNSDLSAPRPWAARALDPSLVAYGAYWEVLDEAHICTLAVRVAWRGRGLGGLMLLALLDEAIARGARAATLEVRASNAVAQRLYSRYGFERAGERKRYYTDNDEDALIMTAAKVDSAGYQQLLSTLREGLWQRLATFGCPPSCPVGTDRVR
jgi:ribosomal-protein-alanine N-acetyltransferase